MSDLTPAQIKKLERLAKVVQDGDVGVLENLLETEEKVEEALKKVDEAVEKVEAKLEDVKSSIPDIKSILEQVKGKDGKDGESIEGPQGIQGVQGPAGKNGRDGKDGRDGRDGQSVVGQAGKDGKDADEVAIQDRIEKNLPALGGAVRDSLELLPEGEKLKIEAIENLRKELDELRKRPVYTGGGGITGTGARDLVKDIDISASLDGVTTTFNIQSIWNIVSVSLDSYPWGTLRKTIDYTFTSTSITFTSTIDPATQLASGQRCILTVVQA